MATVLVTGCRSGIGLATAVASARAGHVVYAGLRDRGTADALMLASAGLEVHPVQLDITSSTDREAAVEQILRERGGLDVLVNNAGVTLGGFLEQVDEAELRHTFEVNVFGTWAMTRCCLPHLRKSTRGKLIFISSMAGRSAFPMLGAYASSKFAVEGLAEAWRHELRSRAVDVVVVEPGAYRTEIFGRNRRMTAHLDNGDPVYAGSARELSEYFQRNVDRIARDPREIGELVVRLIAEENPRLRYPSGPDAWLRSAMMRMLPFAAIEWFFDRVVAQSARGPK